MAIEYTTVEAVYRHAGIDSTIIPTSEIEEHIFDAEAWVDNKLQTTFKTGGRTVTETFDGDGTNGFILKRVGKEWIDADPTLTINTLTIDGESITVGELYVYPETGKVVLKDTAEVQFFAFTKPQQNVINYTFGHTGVPRLINQTTAIVAAVFALAQQIGGTFDDVTSYSLPEFTASKGEPYTNIRETLNQLINRLKEILSNPGMKPVSQMA